MEDWRRSFYALWGSQWITIIGFSIVLPFTPLFVRELGITDLEDVAWWSGVATASMGFGLSITSPIWGALADRHGRKMMVQRAMFGAMVLVGLTGLSRNVYDMIVLRVLQGFVCGTVGASMALVATISPRKVLGRNLGLMQTAVFAGSSLGPLIGGFLSERFGYRPVFGITAILMLVGGLTVTLFVKEQFTPPEGVSALNPAVLVRELRSALSSPGQFSMNFVQFIIHAATVGIAPILALFVESILGEGANVASMSGLVFGATALSSALAAGFIGQFTDRWGHRRIMIVGSLGAVLFGVPQAFVGDFYQLLALRLVQGAFLGAIVPTANAVIGMITPAERRGSAFGVTYSATSAGNVVGPLATAAVAASLGLRTAFIFTSVVLLLVPLAVARLRLPAAGRPAPQA